MKITSKFDLYLEVQDVLQCGDSKECHDLIRDSVCVCDNSYDVDDLLYVLRFCSSSTHSLVNDSDPQKASFFTMIHSFCERYINLFSSLQLGDKNVL